MSKDPLKPVSGFELTPLQHSMFAAAQLTGRPWQYLEQIVVHLPRENIEPEPMAQAWSDLVLAHPALRLQIHADGAGRPRQQIAPPTAVQPGVLDWRDADDAGVAQRLSAFLEQDRNAGVDATKGLAFRVTIILLAGQSAKLVWTFPHSLLDGRGFASLLTEVFQRYQSLRVGAEGPPVAPPETTAFQEHCRTLAKIDHSAGLAHFAQHLEGWEGAQGLIAAGGEPGRKAFARHSLTAAQSEALQALARDTGTAVSTIVLAAWGVVLARATGQGDVVVGTTRNGRYITPGSAEAAGCFITTVPARLRLSPDTTLQDLLQRVRQDQIAARPFEHTPLIEIRRRLDVPQGRQLFDSVLMFDFGTLDEQIKARDAGWEHRQVELLEEGDTAVTVAAYLGKALSLVVEYDPALVPNGCDLAGYLVQFLTALGDGGAARPLAQISMFRAAEEDSIRALAGRPMQQQTDFQSCLDQIEQQVARTPDAPALEQPGMQSLSYAELAVQADLLARHLRDAGVEQGDIVGICLPRSASFICAMLAIWKAGAAFVPMDPGYPVETLNIIAEDSGARIILTGAEAPPIAAPQLNITDLPREPHTKDPVRAATGAEDTAYVIFTSGSTGRPKGVMVSHRSLAAHVQAVAPLYGLSPRDRVLQFAALSFDVALEEVVPTLCTGAALVLRDDAMAQSVPVFLEQIEALQTTVLNLPTGFWVALTEVVTAHDLPLPECVRLVIVGGERVPLSVLRRWRKAFPALRWINGYGPTETTITCTAHEVRDADLDRESVPIGQMLPHAQGWVLCRDGSFAPVGVEGELFISGPAVAKGYVGDPEKTAQSFVPALVDPALGRIYATGDRVHWQDGLLHYDGRMDRQIKLRGFRIEPGQVEAVLEAQPVIDRAHVALYPARGRTQTLVAWYSVARDVTPPSPEDLQGWIAEGLPPQMRPVPVEVTDWPQTPGGKIDTARLPAPDRQEQDASLDAAATTPLTQEVAALFSEMLENEAIGPATSFFDAGGDSLSLLRLLPEIERRFGVALKPAAIYHDPTPRGVVQAMQAQDPDPLVVIPIQDAGTGTPLYAVHVLGDNGSFFRPLAGVLGPDQPVYGLTVGLLSEDTPTAIPDIARFYLHQIERHRPEGPIALVAISAGSYVTLELAQQLLAAGRDVQALILLDAEGPGGRARVSGPQRIAAHLRLLLRKGWPYVAGILAARREMREQDAAQDRLADAPEGGTAGEVANVAAFVAANQLAIRSYAPKPYPRRLTLFRAADDLFDAPEARASGLGWAEVAEAGFDLTDVPGDHLSILQPPHVETLGQHITRLLAGLRAGG